MHTLLGNRLTSDKIGTDQQAMSLTPIPRAVTVRDIAKCAGLSPATISRALKNEPGLTDATRQTVLQIAHDLGYDFGKLRRKRIQRITFLLHSQHNVGVIGPFYTTVLHGAAEACRANGIALSFVVVSPTDKVAKQLNVQDCDAILCAGFFELELLNSLRASGKPVALIDMKMPGFSSVNPDNMRGGYLATQHLIKLGRSKIGMISGSFSHYSIRERNRGHRQALFEGGILADPRYDICVDDGLDPTTGVREAMQTLLDLRQPPDAVFCYNDAAALAAMQTVLAAGLHVPNDISIVGFDDIPDAMSGHRPLTTCCIDMNGLGTTGVKLLLDGSPQTIEKLLPVKLVVRSSSVSDDYGRRH